MAEAKLYIIATPIGNRGDITLRALETLKELTVFFAEDSREFLKLLELYGIPPSSKKVHSYAKHNMKEATDLALGCLQEGSPVGFVCDRGTPAISDPGALIVHRAREEGFGIVPIPGPSSVTTLLSVAGVVSTAFAFVGFLPETEKERKKLFEKIRAAEWPVCFFESPRRIQATLSDLAAAFPRGSVLLGREMTKHFETFQSLRLEDAAGYVAIEKGEYAVLLDPGPLEATAPDEWEAALELRTCPDKAWAKRVGETLGLSTTQVYNALQQRKEAARNSPKMG